VLDNGKMFLCYEHSLSFHFGGAQISGDTPRERSVA